MEIDPIDIVPVLQCSDREAGTRAHYTLRRDIGGEIGSFEGAPWRRSRTVSTRLDIGMVRQIDRSTILRPASRTLGGTRDYTR